MTGAGSGIGRATALAFADLGAAVLAADADAGALSQTLEALRARGGEALSLQVDVTFEAEVAQMIDAAVARFGRLDMAVNSAGIAGSDDARWTLEDYERVMAVNARGVYLCVKHEIAHMCGQGGGAIVNLSSIAGLKAGRLIPYAMSKHAVIGLTRSVARAHARDGIRVNALCPGMIDTPLIAELTSEEDRRAYVAANPMTALGTPEDIAAAAVWLCSPQARLVTGVALPIDGGETLK